MLMAINCLYFLQVHAPRCRMLIRLMKSVSREHDITYAQCHYWTSPLSSRLHGSLHKLQSFLICCTFSKLKCVKLFTFRANANQTHTDTQQHPSSSENKHSRIILMNRLSLFWLQESSCSFTIGRVEQWWAKTSCRLFNPNSDESRQQAHIEEGPKKKTVNQHIPTFCVNEIVQLTGTVLLLDSLPLLIQANV